MLILNLSCGLISLALGSARALMSSNNLVILWQVIEERPTKWQSDNIKQSEKEEEGIKSIGNNDRRGGWLTKSLGVYFKVNQSEQENEKIEIKERKEVEFHSKPHEKGENKSKSVDF